MGCYKIDFLEQFNRMIRSGWLKDVKILPHVLLANLAYRWFPAKMFFKCELVIKCPQAFLHQTKKIPKNEDK